MRRGLVISRNGAARWNGDSIGWVARDDFDFWCFKASPAYGLEDVSAPLRRNLAALITAQCIDKLDR